MELIPVNIIIGDRNYRIKIMPKDEEAVRKSVKIINDKIIEFKTQFAGKDMQDYIAMVLIWFATQQTQQTQQLIADESVQDALVGLEKIMDKILA
jgi:cell division protein ZapA